MMLKRSALVVAAILGFLAITAKPPLIISAWSSAPGPAVIGAIRNLSDDSNLNTRIARIENGLLPPVIIKGQLTSAMTIADRMAHYKVPGVSVAFFDHGQIVWSRSYGLADIANNKPVTTETLFQAASISKPVSALAALRLVQDGKLSLDDKVNIRLRSWTIPENEFTKDQSVTLRRILSHSAGLTVNGFSGYGAGEPVPTVVQILNGAKPANSPAVIVDAVPGTIWRYSGGGYVIIQLLLTDVTERPFPQILHDLVLEPAGMTHSTFEQPLPNSASSIAATPYRANGDPVKGGSHTYPEMAPAGLWTTPSDLARLAIEVQKEYAGKSGKILSQQMMRQMLSHQKGVSGLGFLLESAGQAQRFWHSGVNEGFRCDLEAYIKSGQGLVIMTNSDSGDQVSSEFLRAVAKEYNWPEFQPKEHSLAKVNPVALSAFAGTYEAAGVPKQIVTTRDGKLYVLAESLGRKPVELLPESNTSFFILSDDFGFVFQKNEKGEVSKLLIQIGSQLGPQTLQANKIE